MTIRRQKLATVDRQDHAAAGVSTILFYANGVTDSTAILGRKQSAVAYLLAWPSRVPDSGRFYRGSLIHSLYLVVQDVEKLEDGIYVIFPSTTL